MNARQRWQTLESKRSGVLDRARLCAKLTIPGLLPPEGHKDDSRLPTPYQSLGSRGVNNLASKMLTSLFPPGAPIFKFQIAPELRAALLEKKMLVDAEKKLAEHEQAVARKLDTNKYQPVLFEIFKQLITTGNVLGYQPEDELRMYRLDQYVILRDPSGAPLEVVIKQAVSPKSLSPSVQAAVEVKPDSDETVDVYTHIKWENSRVSEYQEINGKMVPGSNGDWPAAKSPWLPLRWTAVPGQDYGRGHAEEYLGDLMSLEGLSAAVVKFAAAAAKILWLVRPGSLTSAKELAKAASGDYVVGRKEDIEVAQLDKYADFQVVKATIDELSQRLAHCFLIRSGTTRDAERVTAEEIRALAQELEDALGGVYSVQSQELQLPIIRNLMKRMQARKELPQLPEQAIDPVIVTGFAALGRSHGLNRLRAWVSDVKATDPTGGASLKWETINKRMGLGYGVEDLDELVMSTEEMQAQQQQQQLQAAMSASAPGVAQELTKGAVAANAQPAQ